MKIGDRFNSFVKLQDAVEKYSGESFVQFCIHTSSKLENRPDFHNTHLSLAPKELVYYFVKYVCVKSGQYISKAKLRKTKTLKQGCKAGFRVKLSRCSKFLEVVAINPNHNHSISELEFKTISKQRNKIGDEMKALCNVGMNLKSNKQALIHRIQSETGRMITRQDIQNLMNKTKKSTASSTDDLQETEYNCQSNYPQSGNQIVSSGLSSSQPSTTAEQPNESTVDQPSSRNQQENSYFTVGINRMESPSSTQSSKEHLAKECRTISSKMNKLPQNISYIPKQTIPVVDDEMKDFVKSYGMAISKGLDALPADVAIEFSLKVLKELNDKILKTKFEQKSNDDKENGYDWCSVSDENEYDEPDNSDSDAEMGGGQEEMHAEKPNGVTAILESLRKESNTASLTVETVGINNPVSTQAPINHGINERRKSILKRKKPSKDQPPTSTEKDRDVVRSVDDEMQNFVKSYGLTISRGLEILPGDVTIGVALNVLKELNQKVLETKFKRKRSDDNKSIHSWRSVSDDNENNHPDNSDTEMDDCDQVEELPKDNGNNPNNLFLDIPIKIEPEVI